MNRLSTAPLDPLSSGGGHNGTIKSSSAQSSPASIKPKHRKRHSDAAGFETTDSEDGGSELHAEKRPRYGAGVKRACNECRQQKVCVTIQTPTF